VADVHPSDAQVLCVNAGSSSLKLALLQIEPSIVDRWRHAGPFDPTTEPNLGSARDELEREGFAPPGVVVHRIVHGGAAHRGAEVIDDALLADLQRLISFAPLHQPACLAGVTAARRTFPDALHVACYDTAFHHTMPDVATHLGLPNTVWAQGIRRYGFHGLSYQHVVDTVGAERLGRAVIAHLGSGASLCAVADGRSLDTTMGLTPAGGVVMATRAGDLDPGVLIRLLRRGVDGSEPLDADGVEDLVNRRSGLLGLSGSSPDMVTLLAARGDDPAADLAVRIFCRHVAKAIAALAVSLGGIDTLVFTGGIGEHAAPVRAEVCAPLAFLGIRIDPTANLSPGADVAVLSEPSADVAVLVVPADEERVMARQAWALLR
jgi:acetate kinase